MSTKMLYSYVKNARAEWECNCFLCLNLKPAPHNAQDLLLFRDPCTDVQLSLPLRDILDI